jgi:L,D-transpeptidase ErfK/SrfK
MHARITFVTMALIVLLVSSVGAQVYSFGEHDTVVGSIKKHITKNKESLIEIARKYDLGFNEIADANPDVDAFVPGDGVRVIVPTRWTLPNVPLYRGIVINLSEMRLYYFFKKHKSILVKTFPIGIGTEGNNTPKGDFTVIAKIVKPSWYVPESILKEDPTLLKVVPPGPKNPLGSHALRLSLPSILIHGTNRPFGIGRRVSHGCIRLYPEDIPKLFKLVSTGSQVQIIRQPIKIGVKNKNVYMEVHRDDTVDFDYFDEAVKLLQKKNLLKNISTEKFYWALKEKKGIPVNISD